MGTEDPMKPNLSRAGILLIITLALPLVLAILAVITRSIGSADTTLALFLFCTACVYVSFGAGLLVAIWMAIVLLRGGNVERRRMLLLLSVLNIAVAIIWLFGVVPQLHFRW